LYNTKPFQILYNMGQNTKIFINYIVQCTPMTKTPKGRVRLDINIPLEDKVYLDKLQGAQYPQFDSTNEFLNHIISTFLDGKRRFYGNLK
jgi:hypothetical protein